MADPIRCKIVDVAGEPLAPGIVAATPEISRAHIGKLGYAHEEDGGIKIELDDGTVLYGSQCWWERVV